MSPRAWAEDSFTRGLYRLFELQEPAPLVDPERLLVEACADTRALAVVPVHNEGMLEAEWVDRLMRALGNRQLSGFDLILDQWHVEADRAALRRFWRRPKPVANWQTLA